MSLKGWTLWLDIETTGLDPEYHEVCQIAAIATDEQGIIKAVFDGFCKPKFPERDTYDTIPRLSEFAKERHADEDCEPGNWPSLQDTLALFANQMVRWAAGKSKKLCSKPLLIAGWHPHFDLDFLLRSAHFDLIRFDNVDHHLLDVWSAMQAQFLLEIGAPGLGLGKAAETLKITFNDDSRHVATYDIMLTLDVWNELRKAQG